MDQNNHRSGLQPVQQPAKDQTIVARRGRMRFIGRHQMLASWGYVSITRAHGKTWLIGLFSGADINAADAYGYTPLMNAAMLGRLDIVRVLIDAGADIQRKGQFGYTALHAAAQNGHLDVVQALVKYGASVNCKNDDGDIPLILGKTHPPLFLSLHVYQND